MRKQLILLLACLCVTAASYGQQLFRPGMHFSDMTYYNVAAGPLDTGVRFRNMAYFKYKIVDNDVWTKPPNVYLSHLGYVKRIGGFYSAGYLFDGYSFYNRHSIYVGYTYELKLPKTHRIAIGVRGVFNFDVVNWNRVPQSGRKGSTFYFDPDLDVGIQYRVKGLALGFSVKNTIGTTRKVDGEELLRNQREFYANLSYAFNIKDRVVIAPYTLVYMRPGFGLDAGLYLDFWKRVNVSYMFRLTEFRHVYMAGVRVYKGLAVGVGIDHSQLHKDLNFDLMLSHNFGKRR